MFVSFVFIRVIRGFIRFGKTRQLYIDTIMPIQFTCPYCGATTDAVDERVGQSGECVQCGKKITTPASSVKPNPSLKKPRLSVIISCVLVGTVLMCIGPLLSLLIPAVQAARETARRIQCISNMKQISLAMHNYVTANKCFPPAYVTDKAGKPLYSWRVLLLPYIESDDPFSKAFHRDEPWDSPHNRPLVKQIMGIYQCPTAPHTAGDDTTDYVMVVGKHTISDGPHSRKFSEIRDGTSVTIMIVEVANSGIHWAEPKDLEYDKIDFAINGPIKPGIGSHHPGGCNIAVCDASVRFFPQSTPPEKIKAMLTIDGGEDVKQDEF
jgi:hypothetical protein